MKKFRWFLLCLLLALTFSAEAEEFKCLPDATDSGTGPGVVKRWCEINKNDRLLYHGSVWKWYQNGQLKSKEFYIAGKAEGQLQVWFNDGTVRTTGQYLKGTKTGLWTYREKPKEIASEVDYAKGGYKNTSFHSNGAKLIQGTFLASGKIGLWVHWASDGTEIARCDFGSGLLSLPSKACRSIAADFEPIGYSQPIPSVETDKTGRLLVKALSDAVQLTLPTGWSADTSTLEVEKLAAVVHPQSVSWEEDTLHISVRVLFKKSTSINKVIENDRRILEDNSYGFIRGNRKHSMHEKRRKLISSTIKYQPLLNTDSPFPISSKKTIYGIVSYLDISKSTLLVLALKAPSTNELDNAKNIYHKFLSSVIVRTKDKVLH
jgi:hypothetical protein